MHQFLQLRTWPELIAVTAHEQLGLRAAPQKLEVINSIIDRHYWQSQPDYGSHARVRTRHTQSDRGTIARQHLPAEFGKTTAMTTAGLSGLRFPVGTTVDAAERELILQTLAATGQNKTRASDLLGISLKTLHNKLKEYEAGRSDASQPEN